MLKLILVVHVAAGVTALTSMWIPMLARKGARLHRRAGNVFVGAMSTVSVSALVLATARIVFDTRPAAQRGGVFLLLVAVLTAASVSTGVRVLRTKGRTRPQLHWWDIGLSGVLVAGSAGAVFYAVAAREPLFGIFGGLGLVNGSGQLAFWLRAPRSPMHWWFEHMGSMLGACIAATTAFLVTNAPRLGFEHTALAVWVAPGLIGAPAIALWIGYYRRRFDAGPPKARRAIAHSATADSGRPAPDSAPYTLPRSV